MMKGRALLYCFCLVLTVATAQRQLNNTYDLKNTNFGRRFPQTGLFLLHFFANRVKIDDNDFMWFDDVDPTRGDYGFHRYRNRPVNGICPFPQLPSNMGYYALGNLNNIHVRSTFPEYVTHPFSVILNTQQERDLRNLDRIVIQTSVNDPQIIQNVFISQHYEDRNRGSDYDPTNTYRVSPQLLREIHNLTHLEPSHNSYSILESTGSYPPALLHLLDLANYDPNDWFTRFSDTFSCIDPRNRGRRDTMLQCKEYSNMTLHVKSTSNGYSKIMWSGILDKPEMRIGLISDETGKQFEHYPLKGRSSGTIDTKIPLNPGLQVALYKFQSQIWSGPVFDEANGVLPTKIRGYDASLQLYTRNGYACARLYIQKSFTDWRKVFKKSWVGFYKHSLDYSDKYETFQWSTYFTEASNKNYIEDYDIYEYESSRAVGPGVQARFMLDKSYTHEKARTEPWEGVVSASLQLFTRDGYACARLCIQRSFTEWKNVFYNSWVGFYRSSLVNNDNYETYQWSTNFESRSNDVESEYYDTYEYKSSLPIAPGVQIRMMLDWGYNKEGARTEPWKGVTSLPSKIHIIHYSNNDELRKK